MAITCYSLSETQACNSVRAVTGFQASQCPSCDVLKNTNQDGFFDLNMVVIEVTCLVSCTFTDSLPRTISK